MPGPRTFVFLGTGTSVGVPMLGCSCRVCTSPDPRNQRYRCSVLVHTPEGRILIDTPPELRLQLLREKVPYVHAVLFTHYHADHLFGLDDVRPFPRHLGGPVPLYATIETQQKIRQAFAYAFNEDSHRSGLYVPQLALRTIATEPFRVLDQVVTPVLLQHAQYDVLGFRIGDVAYCTDVSAISEESLRRLEGLRVLVLDALRPTPHPAHFGLDQALEVVAHLKPQRTYLTHMSHELEHEATNRFLPPGVELAYDGLRFDF